MINSLIAIKFITCHKKKVFWHKNLFSLKIVISLKDDSSIYNFGVVCQKKSKNKWNFKKGLNN